MIFLLLSKGRLLSTPKHDVKLNLFELGYLTLNPGDAFVDSSCSKLFVLCHECVLKARTGTDEGEESSMGGERT